MENSIVIYLSFIISLLGFVIIGALSKYKSQTTSKDYLLASQQLKPWLVALSAIATNNSGYMFVGMIGYTYTIGLASIWLAVGWIIGDLVASLTIHRHVREVTQKNQALSYPSLIAGWFPPEYVWLKRFSALIVILFLGTYAAAQLNAGSKALYALFKWPYETGAVIGAVIIAIYCYAGGIRASVWTDVAQSFVMLAAMLGICILCYFHLESSSTTLNSILRDNPTYFNWFPSNLEFGSIIGPVLFITGWLFAGFSVAGQPHIMVRFMMLESPNQMFRARCYYYSWYVFFYILTILVGIFAKFLIDMEQFDAELALPMIAIKLFPAPIVGLVLAGLFAATMSTADSQILSCSASLTKDLVKLKDSYWYNKIATLFITLLALIIALFGTKKVFNLVIFSWAVLGATFVPLLCLYVFHVKVSQPIAFFMMITGISTVLSWSQLSIDNTLYSACPGILSGFAAYGLAHLFLVVKKFCQRKT